MSLDLARTVADAVLWEGYLLYPYRASSAKNRIRWQFGVLGPPRVAGDHASTGSGSGVAEDPAMHCECLLRAALAPTRRPAGDTSVHITLRFLHLVRRQPEQLIGGDYLPVDALVVADRTLVPFDEAVECELPFGPFDLSELCDGRTLPVAVPSSVETESVSDANGTIIGRTVRTRSALRGTVSVVADVVGGASGVGSADSAAAVGSAEPVRLSCTVTNTHPGIVADRDAATAVSFLGAHLLLQAVRGSFLSLLEPAAEDEAAANACHQSRCWPVLAGAPGDTDVVLASPIILYDYPAVAPESAGALFDSTEIDEILTLRVMTLTDAEKAAARATDPAAAAIIDRCESMTPETLARLHGTLRDPRAWEGPAGGLSFADTDVPTFGSPDAPWWDPGVDASVSPTTDGVTIDGVRVAKGSLVRIHPSRRADAQDLFYAGQCARVTSVYSDVDDNTHVAVVLTEDPAADLHEWYGRYLYFAPEELEPLDRDPHDAGPGEFGPADARAHRSGPPPRPPTTAAP
ncbi:MAG TPA: hypothetical protein VII33_12055 [Nakamurella sp.]